MLLAILVLACPRGDTLVAALEIVEVEGRIDVTLDLLG